MLYNEEILWNDWILVDSLLCLLRLICHVEFLISRRKRMDDNKQQNEFTEAYKTQHT